MSITLVLTGSEVLDRIQSESPFLGYRSRRVVCKTLYPLQDVAGSRILAIYVCKNKIGYL
jgi:hypothetical protein